MGVVKKAVIPAAGFGTRFLPATKAQPKEMLPIVDTPAIQYIVEEALDSGIEEILIITGRNKRAIEDHFDRAVELEQLLEIQGKKDQLALVEKLSNIRVHFIRQKSPRGLGDAIYCAKAFIGKEPFAVLLGDDVVYNPQRPCLGQLIECYEKMGSTILGAQEVEKDKVNQYGIVAGDLVCEGLYKVTGLVEKPPVDIAPSNLAVLGRYILTADIFKSLESTPQGAGNEVQLTDALARLQSPVYALAYEGKRYDIGDRMGYLQASIEYGLRNPRIRNSLLEYLKNTDFTKI